MVLCMTQTRKESMENVTLHFAKPHLDNQPSLFKDYEAVYQLMPIFLIEVLNLNLVIRPNNQLDTGILHVTYVVVDECQANLLDVTLTTG